MSSWRKKPLVVRAARIKAIDGTDAVFDVGNGDDGWLQAALDKPVGEEGAIWSINGGLRIGTLEGTMRADAGDFVVEGVSGEIYCVKADVFLKTYEPEG